MKTLIPENLKGKALYSYLVANKTKLIAAKKASLKYTNSLKFQPIVSIPVKKKTNKAAMMVTDMEEDGSLNVKVVCNASWWCDDQYDVLTDKAYDKSIADRGILIPHIADHIHTSTNHVGDVQAVYTQKIALKALGVDLPGSTTCAIMETNVLEDYNELTYKFYKNGKINQHSIGLLYVSIGMCINDKDYLPEYEMWQKYYDKVINKDVVDESGFFWIVPEIKWLENSCVWLGCNPLTPTLEVTDNDNEDTEDVPGKSTHNQPSEKSMAVCGNCGTVQEVPDTGNTNCSNCGQFMSANSTVVTVPTFDAIKAIKETTFIKSLNY